jgi:MFS family permease
VTGTEDGSPKRRGYKRYLLVVLSTTLAFSYMDRWALALVTQDIKRELVLSDTEIGLLSGIAFALFYSLMGIPIARLADRSNRVSIIAISTGLWSLAVALCGVAGNFVQLLLVRVGVAVGEAGCLPPANSLIADEFPRKERARAMSRYLLGAPISVFLGYFVAGWINVYFGWRVMFIVLGLPGVLLALLITTTLREPRSARDKVPETPRPDANESLFSVIKALWANRTFRALLLCNSMSTLFSTGIAQWKPAFFIRSFGLNTGEIGTWFGLIYGIGGVIGVYLSGEFATRIGGLNERRQLTALAWLFVSFTLVSAITYVVSNVYIALAMLAVMAVGTSLVGPPMLAIIQGLVSSRRRATSIAVLYLFANLVGLGLGPLLAGILSDLLRPRLGDESLRYALLTLCPGFLWAAWFMYRASRSVDRDLAANSDLVP